MKKEQGVIRILGIFFLVFGMMWVAAIYKRCSVIFPVQRITSFAVKGAPPPIADPLPPGLKWIRSPYAKDYHIVLFRGIVGAEILCAILYALSGWWLSRGYPTGRRLGLAALSADVLYKVFVLSFMKFAAVPLAHATGNPNMLLSYYLPDTRLWSIFSSVLSGLKFLEAGGVLWAPFYAATIGLSFYLLTRVPVKDAREPQ